MSLRRAALLSALLLGVVGLVPHARAQIDHGITVYFTPIAMTDGVQSEWPGAIAVDSTGAAYVVYSGVRSAIEKIIPGRVATGFAGSVSGSIPCIAVDANDHVYAVDGSTIRRFAPDGAAVRLTTGGFVSDQDRTSPSLTLPRVRAIAVGLNGSIYLASNEHTILKVTPDGRLTTFAGATGEAGGADGVASARFRFPAAITVDRSGNVFVADSGNHSIRKITPDGMVSTFAGLTGSDGVEDGTGAAARFRFPYGIAVDRFGTLYVAEDGGRIRRITPGGGVTTLTLSGEYFGFESLAADPSGTLYGKDSWFAAVYMGAFRPGFTVQPIAQPAAPGSAVTFSATVTSAIPVTFQWQKDDVAIPGATASTFTVDNVRTDDLGAYTLVATNKAGSTASYPASLFFVASGSSALLNFSIRSNVGPDARALIVGFTLGGTGTTGPKPLLIRGVGPTLDSFGVAGFLADPMLTIFSGSRVIGTSDNWNGDPQISSASQQVGAFTLAAPTSRDAALYRPDFTDGAYTVQVSGVGGSGGVVHAEIYDATPTNSFGPSTPRLLNLSTLAHVGIGEDALIARFTVGGTAAKTLLIRAIGPALEAFGVTGVLADPKIALYDGIGRAIAENDNWSATGAADTALLADAMTKGGAFPLPADSKDAALLRTLPPGAYSVRVSGVGGATGGALLEIYQVP